MKFAVGEIKKIPLDPGVYRFYSRAGGLLYVGKAKVLRNRISGYFDHTGKHPKIENLVSQIACIDIIPVASEFEALLLEAKLIKENQPKYNVIWKDDKHYLYIKITGEKYPKILFARKKEADGEYFGPFPSSGVVKQILSYIRTIFPYCTQNHTAGRSCFYHHLGLCNPCPAVIDKLPAEEKKKQIREYRRNIANIKKILRGKITPVGNLLREQMETYSGRQEFEPAAVYRDKLRQLQYLVSHGASAESYLTNPKLLSKIRAGEGRQLAAVLHPFFPELASANRIECYDISNTSGKLATGSMVVFRNGQPQKDFYRHFRIKLHRQPDDFAMLSEVLARRLKHGEWPLPDLFLIDGGRPQLAALKKVLRQFGIDTPMIGLAKKEEEMVIPAGDAFVKIKLPASSPALNLIKRIRDEAHRFAHKYHLHLRLKHLLSSVEKG